MIVSRHAGRGVLFVVAVASGAVLAAGATLHANILANGDFEADPDGTTVVAQDAVIKNAITAWRVFGVGGAKGTAKVTGAAASSGAKGIELSYDIQGLDSAIDKDEADLGAPISGNRVYRLLVDARDGGPYGGTPHFAAGLQIHQAGTNNFLGGRGFGFDPGAAFETVGTTMKAPATAGWLSSRFDVGGVAGRSVHLDNARVVDVTTADRMINGGFENSASRLLGWRFFAVAGAAGTATLSPDANSGQSAVLLQRTGMAGDSGLDTWGGDIDIAAIGGETVNLSFAAKRVSGTGRIGWNISMFDANHTYLATAAMGDALPGTAAYSLFSSGNVTLLPGAAYISVGFRVFDAPSAFLIDDVKLVPEPTMGLLLLAGVPAVVRRRRTA